jgi:hypothetical protein
MPGNPVMVRNMLYPPLPAHRVRVALEGPCDLEPDKINMLLQKQQQGRAFKLLNKIVLRYLGSIIKFVVTKVTTKNELFSEKDVDKLTEKFKVCIIYIKIPVLCLILFYIFMEN